MNSKNHFNFDQDHKYLLNWYKTHQRILPWRASKDPYKIWISEVMLQQTTVAAVIPYFERFIKKFPTVHDLANSSLEELYEVWAGLGYYSRARNLHKASKQLSSQGFPQTYSELIQLPGMGPYTSRAVSSIAFNEPVGVLDGNVIRVLSRKYGIKSEWWKTKERNELQNISDEIAKIGPSSEINQALMELGATICSPKKVTCVICPWNKSCVSLKQNLIQSLPMSKPKKETEIWLWNVLIYQKKGSVAYLKNTYAPFLKNSTFFPGTAKKLNSKPKDFSARHSITNHDIYIKIETVKSLTEFNSKLKKIGLLDSEIVFLSASELKKVNPASLMTKVLNI